MVMTLLGEDCLKNYEVIIIHYQHNYLLPVR
jgi:hypothetical protein